MSDEFWTTNQAYWDELAELHYNSRYSAYYDIMEFKQGKSSLLSTELHDLGDITGKKILHLQCHFGLDTLSLARLGAEVTGIDFSSKAISIAKTLSSDLNIPATFIHSDITSLRQILLNEVFDIVFTSYGVLVWLNDLTIWAQTISHFLIKKGFFYIVEEHPFACVFSGSKEVLGLKPEYPYQNGGFPYVTNNSYSYADNKTKVKNAVQYKWSHSMSEIINCLIQDSDGWWRLVSCEESIPLMFSLMATKQ